MKKLFLISSVLLGITLFLLGVYNFAFKKNSQVIATPAIEEKKSPEETKKELEQKKAEKIVLMSEQKTTGAVLDSKNKKILFYDVQDGTSWSISEDGKEKKQISQTKIPGLKSVAWSPDRSKTLTMIEKDGQSFFYEYDYVTDKGTQLKAGLDSAAWDNVGAKIFYKYFNQEDKKRSLNISNSDGGDWKKIADIETRNLSIAPVPFSSLVSFWNYPDAKEETKLQIVGMAGGEIRTLLAGRYGADYLWSPDGSKALVSSLRDKNKISDMSLGIVSLNGDYKDLSIPTVVSKCVWSVDNKTLYYALPGEIPEGSVMPNDYQANKFNTSDTFWKVDIDTGEKKRIIETNEINNKYDSSNLFLSSTEDALLFINKTDQKIYKMSM